MNQQQLKQLEEEYYQNQKKYTKRELLEIFPEAREYLEKERKLALTIISAFENIVKFRYSQISKLKDEFSRWFSTEVLKITEGETLNKWDRRLKEVEMILNSNENKNPNKINSTDIEIAKQYPIDSLMQFNSQGFSLCPFHIEKTKSFKYYKNTNTCHCFGCNWSGDAIKFAMEYYGISFIEAVKYLANK